MGSFDITLEFILIMLPLMLIQMALMIFALIHVLRHDTYKVGNKLVWVIVVLFVNIVGPILYFLLGKDDN